MLKFETSSFSGNHFRVTENVLRLLPSVHAFLKNDFGM